MSGGAPGKEQSSGELKTARTLNTVAIIGATHPLVTSSRKLAGYTPDRVKQAAGRLVPKGASDRVKQAAGRLVPKGAPERVRSVTGRVKGRIPHTPAKYAAAAGAAGAAGWVGFHGAELAGDFMGRRAINGALQRKEQSMSKSIEASLISKGIGGGQPTVGVNLSKRYYDAESDRQRRMGVIAGIAGGTSLVTGAEAARRITAEPIQEATMMDGSKIGPKKGLKGELLPVGRRLSAKGNKKVLAGLVAASALSGGLGAGTYRHGMSRRNRSWQ